MMTVNDIIDSTAAYFSVLQNVLLKKGPIRKCEFFFFSSSLYSCSPLRQSLLRSNCRVLTFKLTPAHTSHDITQGHRGLLNGKLLKHTSDAAQASDRPGPYIKTRYHCGWLPTSDIRLWYIPTSFFFRTQGCTTCSLTCTNALPWNKKKTRAARRRWCTAGGSVGEGRRVTTTEKHRCDQETYDTGMIRAYYSTKGSQADTFSKSVVVVAAATAANAFMGEMPNRKRAQFFAVPNWQRYVTLSLVVGLGYICTGTPHKSDANPSAIESVTQNIGYTAVYLNTLQVAQRETQSLRGWRLSLKHWVHSSVYRYTRQSNTMRCKP